jgi:UDP-glucuronate decarboxylase
MSSRINPQLQDDGQEILARLNDQLDVFSGKRLLITGAAGFLGSQFINFFRLLNHCGRLASRVRVFAWDTFLRGEPAWLSSLASEPWLTV